MEKINKYFLKINICKKFKTKNKHTITPVAIPGEARVLNNFALFYLIFIKLP
jgi:hypothetical protein